MRHLTYDEWLTLLVVFLAVVFLGCAELTGPTCEPIPLDTIPVYSTTDSSVTPDITVTFELTCPQPFLIP